MNVNDLEVSLQDDSARYQDEDDDYDDEEMGPEIDLQEELPTQEGIMDHEEDDEDVESLTVDGNDPFAKLQSSQRQQGCFGRLLNCCFGSTMESPEFDKAPDDDFYADNLIELPHGYTAYRLLEPAQTMATINVTPPLIILLHGMQNSSYMWADIAELLADFEQGPQAQVLVFDFYGRGRSPWTGIPVSLDLLVTQIKDLMEALGLSGRSAALVGYDLGGAVAAGFAARYPHLCTSLTLIGPIGLEYDMGLNDSSFATKYLGEISMAKQKKKLPEIQENEFHNTEADAAHRYLIDRQIAMSHWQIKNTPGYLGALLSTFRNFPIHSMDELYAAVGRHNRPVLVIWGKQDNVCPNRECIAQMEESFPKGVIVDILDCGHNCVFEKFEDVVTELLNFHRDVFVKSNKKR